jgi:predicted GNAT family N-acyltransferase
MGDTSSQVPRFEGQAPKVSVRRIRDDEADRAFALAREHLAAAVAADDDVRAIYRHNPDTFWGIYAGPDEAMVGFYSFLLLTMDGVLKLLAHELDPTKPDVRYIAAAGERPAAVYVWAVVAKGLTKVTGPLIIQAMTSLYWGLPIYATAGTHAGLNKIITTGLRPVVEGDTGIGALYVFDAYPAQAKPPQLATRDDKLVAQVRVTIAATPDDIDRVRAIRAAVYMAEQDCPYDEEFDGNDYTATHVLGYIDGEPAATLRIRYFANFVKFERLALLPKFRRRTLLTKQVVNFAIEFCRRKGYTIGIGHAQKRLVPFWKRFGFEPLDRGKPLFYSDHQYVEMRGQFPPHDNPITMDADPYLVVRPEGRWDEEGVLDRSTARPATNPVGGRA